MRLNLLLMSVLFIAISSCNSNSDSKEFYKKVNGLNNSATAILNPFLQNFMNTLNTAVDEQKYPSSQEVQKMKEDLTAINKKVESVIEEYNKMEEFDNEVPLLEVTTNFYKEIDKALIVFERLINLLDDQSKYEDLKKVYNNEYASVKEKVYKLSNQYQETQKRFYGKYNQ